MVDFRNVRFLKSAKSAEGLPPWPQIALLGRSNVGKSSLLNDLFQRRGMAKTSSTPGKTQLLNFFEVDEKLLFVDLPGYGYAKVSGAVKQEWGSYLEEYLKTPDLALLLLDVRREPSRQDLEMASFLEAQGIPTLVVVTKVDKVGKTKRPEKMLKDFAFPQVFYSVTKREGRQKLINMVIDGIAEKNRICLP